MRLTREETTEQELNHLHNELVRARTALESMIQERDALRAELMLANARKSQAGIMLSAASLERDMLRTENAKLRNAGGR